MKMILKILCSIGIIAFSHLTLLGQENNIVKDTTTSRIEFFYHNSSHEHKRLNLTVPLFDFTYQSKAAELIAKENCVNCSVDGSDYLKAIIWPSMNQSQIWSTSYYNSVNFGIKHGSIALFKKVKNEKRRNLFTTLTMHSATTLTGIFTDGLPLSMVWGHEEFHKNVLTVNDAYSFNDVYRWGNNGGTLNVSKVKDEDLIRLKEENNEVLVRAHAAGGENDLEMATSLQKQNFFYDLDLPHLMMYWYGTMSYIVYLRDGTSPENDYALYDDLYYSFEGSDESLRDYVGWDFQAWSYDLHRPNAKYEDRGPHPSGVGIDRYIEYSELSSEELKYLKKQGNLALLNLASPFLFGINSIQLTKEKKNGAWYGNFHIRHHLTSFGNDIELGVFLKNNRYNFIFSGHSYSNRDRSFPGIGIELVDFDLRLKNYSVYLSSEFATWLQPRNQEFVINNGEAGALFRAKIRMPVKKWFNVFCEFETKSKGWVAANPYLSGNSNFRFGLNMNFD